MLDEQNLIWIDLEMTGLDPQQDSILEIATIVTDKLLNELAVGPIFALHTDLSVLATMDDWNTSHHGKSGLLDRVKQSDVTMADAEAKTIDFLKQYVPPRTSPICGNSICQDRRFLYMLMPELEAYFHYRNLDVSTIKELASRWKPEILSGYSKKGAHLALEDIRESIDELKYYRQKVFVQELAFHQQLDHPTAEELDHRLESGERDVEEGTLLIKATLENDCVEMRVPPQHVPERLVRDDHAGKEWPAGGLVVEIT